MRTPARRGTSAWGDGHGRRLAAALVALGCVLGGPAAEAQPSAAPTPTATPPAAAPAPAATTQPAASQPAATHPDASPAAPADPRVALRRGLEAFEYGQYAACVALLRPLVEEDRLRGADRIQALRAYGVALFLLGRRGGAEAAFLMLLREDPSARLDPALVPPEAIAFLDDVRARNQALVQRAIKARKPSGWLNLLPPLGQFQNGQRAKGWLILALEIALLGADIATYWVARSMPRADGTVASESRFNTVKTLNIVSFCALLGTIVYGVADGFYFFGARERAAAGMALVPAPLPGGAALSFASRF